MQSNQPGVGSLRLYSLVVLSAWECQLTDGRNPTYFYNIGGSGGIYLVASTDGQAATFMTDGLGSTCEPNGAANV